MKSDGEIVRKRLVAYEAVFTNIEFKKDVTTSVANRFCFAVPEGMVSKDEVPDYAGLIYIKEDGSAYYVKKPPLLHSLKHPPEKQWNKIYYLYENDKRRQLFES